MSNFKATYVLTFELYYDSVRYGNDRDGHFFNVLARYYDKNSNVTVNARSAAVGRIISKIIASSVGVFKKQIGLVKYDSKDLYKFDIIMSSFKNARIHQSDHTVGIIYDITYDTLLDMLNDFKLKYSIELDNYEFNTIEDL